MAQRATTPDYVEFPEDELLDDEYSRATLQGLQTPQQTLAEAAIAAAFKPAGIRRMQRPGAAVIVEIPSPGWAADVEMIVRTLASFGTSFNRVGLSKVNDRPIEGNGRVAEHLSRRGSVLGISTSPEMYLPSALVAAADVRVRIETPSNRIVAHVIRKATGRRPRRLPPNAAAGLDFGEICSCIRIGSTPAECVRRLASAVRSKLGTTDEQGAVPALSELHGYEGGAMDWALDLVRDLTAWRAGKLDWSAISRTATFTGPPGTGKTTFIRSIAKSAGLPIVATSVSSWFTGMSNGHLDGVLREFERVIGLAAAQAPAILFLDELDGLPNRSTMSNRGKDWWLPVINGVLLALDSTTSGPTSKLIVIGATNHGSQLDPALVRPGRLYPVIEIRPPSIEALAGIIRQHLGPDDLPGVDVSGVARLGGGATGAEATAWVRDARRVARDAGRPMILADLVGRVAPPDNRTEEELILCARHEAAHATACHVLGVGVVKEVTILLKAGSAGNMSSSIARREIMTRADIENLVIVSLAGRAQDALAGAANTGAGGSAQSDLAAATAYILLAHTSFGLGGTLTYIASREEAWDQLRRDPGLRERVETDLTEIYAQGVSFVGAHQPAIQAISQRLLVDRIVSGDEVRRLIAENAPLVVHAIVPGGIDAR
ncbi:MULTISPECIES: AAA family ATPase [unclassified Methylobacterium]|uniref:AAA family ATPase n=1 Tax=unclassified Methylobacterium TaxID=2615210 RepID=UPI00226AEB02|nr:MULTISPECIES: AAA family ATPase [unclassified Methylobacterium]